MNINRNYISAQNTYANNNPQYIVVHNTDNFSAGANALAHAKAQHDGNFSGMSAHYYVDDKDKAYQATEHRLGTWHCGKNYGGKLFGTVNNRNSIGVEMCVQKGYDYEKAFQNTAELVRQLMTQTGIPADRVLQHYDVCAKNCPSQIRAKGDWQRFKNLISGAQTTKPVQPAEQPADWKATGTATCSGNNVNVRQSPGGTILLSLNKGNRFEVDGKTSGMWTHVKVQSVIGWMATQYVVLDKAQAAQPAQNASSKIMLKVTGLWDEDTTKRLQQYFGLPQDGKVSNQLNAYKHLSPGIVSAEWSSTSNGGSMLVRKMEAWLNIKEDGYIGSGFNIGLQDKFGKVQDGVLSNPSQTITAMQEWLNQQP